MAASDQAQRLFKISTCIRTDVHTWPRGTSERRRSPRGERLHRRAMLVAGPCRVEEHEARRVEIKAALEPASRATFTFGWPCSVSRPADFVGEIAPQGSVQGAQPDRRNVLC